MHQKIRRKAHNAQTANYLAVQIGGVYQAGYQLGDTLYHKLHRDGAKYQTHSSGNYLHTIILKYSKHPARHIQSQPYYKARRR